MHLIEKTTIWNYLKTREFPHFLNVTLTTDIFINKQLINYGKSRQSTFFSGIISDGLTDVIK